MATGGKRTIEQVQGMAGPGSASPARRTRLSRLSFCIRHNAGFVELAPQWKPTTEELYRWLEECDGAQIVAIEGDTCQVWCGVCTPEQPIQFEIARRNQGCSETVSVCFRELKDKDLVPHAWMILRQATCGK